MPDPTRRSTDRYRLFQNAQALQKEGNFDRAAQLYAWIGARKMAHRCREIDYRLQTHTP